MTSELTIDDKYMMLVSPWYVNLIDDCKDLITEVEFTSRWTLVEGYHTLGSRILIEYENFQRLRMDDSSLVQHVAISLGKKPRTIYYAIQFARQYPDLNLLPEGKNISWHHIVNKYLTTEKERVTLTKMDIINMVKEIRGMLQIEWNKQHQSDIERGYPKGSSECNFIRYLQDQVDKITERLEL